MSTGWDNYESAPIEFLHGRMMALFHDWRIKNFGKDNTTPKISGSDLTNIIAKAKKETYAKYPKQVSREAILKSEI